MKKIALLVLLLSLALPALADIVTGSASIDYQNGTLQSGTSTVSTNLTLISGSGVNSGILGAYTLDPNTGAYAFNFSSSVSRDIPDPGTSGLAQFDISGVVSGIASLTSVFDPNFNAFVLTGTWDVVGTISGTLFLADTHNGFVTTAEPFSTTGLFHINVYQLPQFGLAHLDVSFSTVPEPASLLLLTSGLAGVASFARRRRLR